MLIWLQEAEGSAMPEPNKSKSNDKEDFNSIDVNLIKQHSERELEVLFKRENEFVQIRLPVKCRYNCYHSMPTKIPIVNSWFKPSFENLATISRSQTSSKKLCNI